MSIYTAVPDMRCRVSVPTCEAYPEQSVQILPCWSLRILQILSLVFLFALTPAALPSCSLPSFLVHPSSDFSISFLALPPLSILVFSLLPSLHLSLPSSVLPLYLSNFHLAIFLNLASSSPPQSLFPTSFLLSPALPESKIIIRIVKKCLINNNTYFNTPLCCFEFTFHVAVTLNKHNSVVDPPHRSRVPRPSTPSSGRGSLPSRTQSSRSTSYRPR